MRPCQNNPENSYTEKKVKHKPSGYAWCSGCLFDETKSRRHFHRRKDIFSVPLQKENDNGKIITYILKFIDSYRFMSTSLS